MYSPTLHQESAAEKHSLVLSPGHLRLKQEYVISHWYLQTSHRVCQEGSETPTPVETRGCVPSGPRTDPEPLQLVADEMQESTALSTPGIMDARAPRDFLQEGMQIGSTADNSVTTDSADVWIDGDNIEQPLQEEEEEGSKHEDDKSEHDDIDIERDIPEEQTVSGERQQKEDKGGLVQEPSNVTEDQQAAEGGTPPLSLEDQAQEITDEIRQQTEDETSEEQEPVQVTRRMYHFTNFTQEFSLVEFRFYS